MKSIRFALFVAGCVFLHAQSGVAQTTTLDDQQSAFLTLINNFRAQNGLGPVQVSATLQQSSQWMSSDMATKNYFSHTDSLGRDPFTRMTQFGYTFYPEGENIAAGNSDAQNTFVQWQTACDPDSSGACTYAHRQNMLDASFTAIGIGRVYNATSTYRWYWTTDFGGYVDQPLSGNSNAAPTVSSFTAAPATISAGQQVTFNWSVSGATTITIDNGVGDVTGLNSTTIMPSATKKYTLTAANANGSNTASVTVTVNAATAPSAAISIWPNTSAPTKYVTASGPIEFGVKIRSDVAGQVTGIRFYKIAANTGVHTGSLWSSDGQLLATGTFTAETATGWQTLKFTAPVTIRPNTTYVASYHTNAGIGAFGSELQSSGKDNAPLHALQTGVDGANGVYTFSSGGKFPAQGSSGSNFWVDILFVP